MSRILYVFAAMWLASSSVALAQPTVWFSPHDFGSVNVGQSSATHTIRVENLTGSALALTFLESASAPFALTGSTCPNLPVTLQPSDPPCFFDYQFSPTSGGQFSTSLDLFWQAGTGNSGSVQFELSGTGVAPILDVTPASGAIDFGDVDVGQNSSIETFTLSNGGSLDVDVSTIQHPTAPFVHVGGSCSTPPFTLAFAQSCTLDYLFSPTSTGLQNDNVIVLANIPAGSLNLSVSGNGLATGSPQLSIDPVLVDFGLVQVGLVTPAIDVTYENTGTLDLTVSLMDSVTAPFFILSNGCPTPPFDLTPGQSCQISYTFAPAADGTATQVISIASNDPSPGGHAITLTGQAEHSVIDVVPSVVDFLSVPLGQSPTLPLDVVNAGSYFDVNVFGPDGLGPLPPEFDIQPGSCSAFPFVLGPGDSCQLHVTFTPSAPGPAGHANMLNHDASSGSGSYSLTGNGVEDSIFHDRFEP